jgi:hypothetical protein
VRFFSLFKNIVGCFLGFIGELGVAGGFSRRFAARYFLTFMALSGPKKSLVGNVLLYLGHFTFF